MPKLRLLIGVLFLTWACQHASAVPSGIIPEDKGFPSPNGRFTVQLETPAPTREIADLVPRVPGSDDLRNAEPKYVVVQHGSELVFRDKTTGQVKRCPTLTPVYSVRWTGDSKTMVATYHLSHLTGVSVIHFHLDEWQRHDIEPPFDADFWGGMLIRQKLGRKGVELTYKVIDIYRDPETNRRRANYYVCTYVVNGDSGTLTQKGKNQRVRSSIFDHTRYYGDR